MVTLARKNKSGIQKRTPKKRYFPSEHLLFRSCHPILELGPGLFEDSGVLRIGNNVGVLARVLDHVIKLFAFDIFALEPGYRVGAFLGLGGILVLAGFLYQRYSRAIRGFLLE